MIAISGLGRIGRSTVRAFLKRGILVVLHDKNPSEIISHLLTHDTVYGRFESSGDINIISGSTPNWSELGIDIVIDCSGNAPIAEHLRNGAKIIVISAPVSADATLIFGVNHTNFDPIIHRTVSMASCTMNAIAPIIMPILSNYSIKYLDLVSVNAYTNSQSLVDSPNIDLRLARAANSNIILSESSTKNVIDKIFPQLSGKYNAVAFRVPVLCGSVSYLSIVFDKSPVGILSYLKSVSEYKTPNIVEYSNEPLVSSDIIGNSHSAIIDGLSAKVGKNSLHLAIWYDNEFGYASRLVDLALYISDKLGKSEGIGLHNSVFSRSQP